MLVICGAEPEMSISSAFMKVPGGGLGIFTDRNQQSIFLGFEFRKSLFLRGTAHNCCIFWAVR